MKVAVIGAGNGGLACAVELSLAGHEVFLHGRSASTIAPYANGIRYTGVFGTGSLRPKILTTDLSQISAEAEIAVVCLPTLAHITVADALHAEGWSASKPVILNPGHTGGAFEFETAYRGHTPQAPPIVAFSTLAYVARKSDADGVYISGRANALRAAALPGGKQALEVACQLFPGAYDSGDVIACDLSNVNMVVHPPGAILGVAWVEATRGNFTFYVEGMTPGVIEVMRALDDERIRVASAFGHSLPTIIEEMVAIGTVPDEAAPNDYAAIAAGEANRRIRAPDTLAHRYYSEDLNHGLVPFLAYAEVAGIQAPTAASLVSIGLTATRNLPRTTQRTAKTMGFEGRSLPEILARARG